VQDHLLKKTSAWHNATSAYNLGTMYLEGDGVLKDVRRASELFRSELPLKGEARSTQYDQFFTTGVTVPNDFARAMVFYQLAPAQDDYQASWEMQKVKLYRTWESK